MMPHSENSCTYDIPLPPPSSGKMPPKMATTTRFADQNYRTPEYHDFVRELVELHRPIVKSTVIMVCPVCDRNWRELDDSTRYLICSFWSRANNMGIVIYDPDAKTPYSFAMNTTGTSVTVPDPSLEFHNLKPGAV